jgi:ferredoxin
MFFRAITKAAFSGQRLLIALRPASSEKGGITVRWKLKNGNIVSTSATIGSNLLRVAHDNDIELEGACEGVCACSTCHVILEAEAYNSLAEPEETEDDMLDLAFGLTPTSRLGCQVVLQSCHDGMTVTLPKATRNFYVVQYR